MKVGILLLCCTTYALGVEHCIDKDGDWMDRKEYQLSCKDGGILMEVNVSSGTGNCKVSECEGLTPYLIENQYSCYWKNKCSVRVPNIASIDIIVRVPIVTTKNSCFAQTPDYMQINNALCFKVENPKQLVDAVLDFKATQSPSKYECDTGESETSGVIRSHFFYPWDYEGPNVFDHRPGYKYEWNHVLCYDIHRSISDQQKLIITVRDLDLWSGDNLTLVSLRDGEHAGGNVTLTNSDVGRTIEYDGKHNVGVRLIFNVNVSSIGGRGFLLCFANVDFINGNQDACDEISTPATVVPFMNTDIALMREDNVISDVTTPSPVIQLKPETCKDCKKRCRKEPKKEQKTCRKGCKPLCKKKGGKETCKDCKKRCRKEPRKERKTCRKDCKPLCKKKGGKGKGKGKKKGRKDRKRNKGKNEKQP